MSWTGELPCVRALEGRVGLDLGLLKFLKECCMCFRNRFVALFYRVVVFGIGFVTLVWDLRSV